VLPIDPAAGDVRKDTIRPGRVPLRSILATLRYVAALRRRLLELQPDLVHTNTLKAAVYGGLAGRLARIPVVWHVRDRIADDYLPKPAVIAIRLLARRIPTALIANSYSTLATLGALQRPSSVTPSPVVYDAVAPTAERRLGSDRPFTVGIVGRLAQWKGQHVFLRAFAAAFPDGPHRAVVVGAALFGEDAYAAELEALARELGIEDRVTFTGFQRDVFGALATMDVLVHASITPEPFGQVVLEGLIAGVPVIASDAGGPAELLTHEDTGLLVRPGDVEALAAAMRRLGAEDALRRRLADRGRELAAKFAPDQLAVRVVDLYRRVPSVRAASAT
jgi:glycosyltransferase involved in cell wall biosynthesis